MRATQTDQSESRIHQDAGAVKVVMEHCMNEQTPEPELSGADTPVEPLPALSPEEERVERFCRHLARIIRGVVDSPSPDVTNSVARMEEQ